MMKSKFEFIWDGWNKIHIKKHKVSQAEVEEIQDNYFVKKKSYKDRELIFGQTKKGRLLTIVVSYERQKKPYVVSARDISSKERRYYDEKAKTN